MLVIKSNLTIGGRSRPVASTNGTKYDRGRTAPAIARIKKRYCMIVFSLVSLSSSYLSFNAPVRDQPPDCHQNVQGTGKPRMPKGKGDCQQIKQRGNLSLEVAPKRMRQG